MTPSSLADQYQRFEVTYCHSPLFCGFSLNHDKFKSIIQEYLLSLAGRKSQTQGGIILYKLMDLLRIKTFHVQIPM
jgi:hypothetical protein